MKTILTVALGATLAAASASAAAADANGAFFVNAGVGQAQYHVGHDGPGHTLDDKDTAGALRFGYVWPVADGLAFGVEGGYVDLGKMTADLDYSPVAHAELKTKGWLLGVNGKYNFAGKWYAQARGGWFRSRGEAKGRVFDPFLNTTFYGSADGEGNGWYGGMGLGYDLAPNFSMGLNYDNYHAKTRLEGLSTGGNVGVFSLSAEFRF